MVSTVEGLFALAKRKPPKALFSLISIYVIMLLPFLVYSISRKFRTNCSMGLAFENLKECACLEFSCHCERVFFFFLSKAL